MVKNVTCRLRVIDTYEAYFQFDQSRFQIVRRKGPNLKFNYNFKKSRRAITERREIFTDNYDWSDRPHPEPITEVDVCLSH